MRFGGKAEAVNRKRQARITLSAIRIAAALLVGSSLAIAASSLSYDPSDPKEGVAFAVIGDSGTGHAAQYRVARQMTLQRQRSPFDFVLMCGDNIYPRGDPSLFKSRFEQPYKDLLEDGVKFYASLGNHDVTRGTDAELHYENFNMDGHRYYSFTKAGRLIEFFAIDSTDMNEEEKSWLEQSLKASTARWKVVFCHHPIYCSARKHGSSMSLRAVLEPLFIRYNVDVVFAGHDHVYERMKPQHGIYYFTEGASGQLRKDNIDRTSPIFDAGDDRENSFLLVQVHGSRMTVEAIGTDGKILDSAVIDKENAR